MEVGDVQKVQFQRRRCSTFIWSTSPIDEGQRGVPPNLPGAWVCRLFSSRFQGHSIVMCCCFSFSEMPTNKYVESSFWNFDALFQPQQHPARDAHDTFFLSDPATSDRLPADYVERVKTVHSTGGYGSIGLVRF